MDASHGAAEGGKDRARPGRTRTDGRLNNELRLREGERFNTVDADDDRIRNSNRARRSPTINYLFERTEMELVLSLDRVTPLSTTNFASTYHLGATQKNTSRNLFQLVIKNRVRAIILKHRFGSIGGEVCLPVPLPGIAASHFRRPCPTRARAAECGGAKLKSGVVWDRLDGAGNW